MSTDYNIGLAILGAVLTRRELLKAAALAAATPRSAAFAAVTGEVVNDIHSGLNPTRVAAIERPLTLDELRTSIRRAARRDRAVSMAGGRHSMGGQEFGSGTVLIDTRGLDRVLGFDPITGHVEVEAGIEWPPLIQRILELQKGSESQWAIAQKQTGADRLTLGGGLSANIHGRGLTLRPLIGNVAAFQLVDAKGKLLHCSREENSELFRLAIGGYGLFGVIYSVTLQLSPRRKLERIVEVVTAESLADRFEQRIADGFLYGDFQFAIDPKSEDFLRRGVFSSYRPVSDTTAMPASQRELSDDDWKELIYLAHADKSKAFDRYASYYLSTNGQLYWSDTHQLSPYFDGYHQSIDQRLHSPPASEVLTELYVPRARLNDFLTSSAAALRDHGDEVIYGTVRLIERDDETVLAWARQRYACIVINLHVVHTPERQRRAADAFRRLIDLAIERGGSFYLTYHRHATRAQIEVCYPRFAEFLRKKLEFDPGERFQSEWYRHYRRLFA